MQTAVNLLGIYQRSGLQTAVRKTGMLRVLPEHLRTMEQVLPPAPKRKDMKERPRFLPAAGPVQKRAAFFLGLLNGYDVFSDKSCDNGAFTGGRV